MVAENIGIGIFMEAESGNLSRSSLSGLLCVFFEQSCGNQLYYIHLLFFFLDSSWRKGGIENTTISCQNDCIGIYVSFSAPLSVISKGFNSSSQIKSGSLSFSSFQPPSFVFSFSHFLFLFFSFPQKMETVLEFIFYSPKHNLPEVLQSFGKILFLHTMLLVFLSILLEDQLVFQSRIC